MEESGWPSQEATGREWRLLGFTHASVPLRKEVAFFLDGKHRKRYTGPKTTSLRTKL